MHGTVAVRECGELALDAPAGIAVALASPIQAASLPISPVKHYAAWPTQRWKSLKWLWT